MVHGTPKFRMSPLTWKPGARVLDLSLSPIKSTRLDLALYSLEAHDIMTGYMLYY